jgi:predicted AlkP superfamily phosphohydrolase/phosphomutase
LAFTAFENGLSGKSRYGLILVGVLVTYPPKPLKDHLVSCFLTFLTPTIENTLIFPSVFKTEVNRVINNYMLDVSNFRTEDRDWLLVQIYQITDKRF